MNAKQCAASLPPVKLAMVLFRYFPWGGMQANFLRIARACVAQGYQVDVYTLDWEGERPADLEVNIITVPGKRNIVRYGHFIKRVQSLTRAREYALVMGFNRMPGLDLYYAADPCFVERIRKTRPWYYPLSARYRHFSQVEKALFEPQSATHILALSALQIEEYTRRYATQESRFSLLPPAVELRYRRPGNARQQAKAFREEYRIPASQRIVLMIGSGFKRKGMDRGLRAVAALSPVLRDQCQLFILGKGRHKPLRRLARRLGIDARLTMIEGTPDVPRFMLAADLLMHPARNENTGNVIVEALAAGLPVLCSGTCGYADHVVRAQAGVVLDEPFAQQNLDQSLSSMFNFAALRRWQQAALTYATHEDLYSRTERVLEIIDGLIEQGTAHA